MVLLMLVLLMATGSLAQGLDMKRYAATSSVLHMHTTMVAGIMGRDVGMATLLMGPPVVPVHAP